MKVYIILFFLLTFNLCGQEGIIYERNFIHDNAVRSYLLYVPNACTPDENWPLVINYHGFSTSAVFQMNYTQMNVVADTAHFLIAYPQGLIVTDRVYGESDYGWHIPGRWIADQDDVVFTDSLINHIQNDFKIDIAHIHATGFSNGSEMAFYLACMRPNIFGSVGGVAGGMIDNLLDSCQVGRPISIVLIHGTADPLVPINGMEEILAPAQSTASFWSLKNKCSMDSIVTDLPDVVKEDSCTVTLMKYIGCENKSEVLFYQINNGGHTWPSGYHWPEMDFLGYINQDIHASSVMWNFFKRFPHPDPAVGVINFEKDLSQRIRLLRNYPNPFNPTTSIEYELSKPAHVQLTICDLRGRHIKTLANQHQSTGRFQTTWEGMDECGVPATGGIYFCRMQAGDFIKVIKLVLVR